MITDAHAAPAHESSVAGFAGVVDEHHARIYRFLLRIVGNAADAEDLTQQTFLEAYRSFAHFSGNSSVSSWLHGIALNLARNHRRSIHARHFDGHAELTDVLAAGGADPEAGAVTHDLLRRALAELNRLPDDTRFAFVLVVLDGWSYEEAARSLEVPVATVRGRVFRARARIREALDVTYSETAPLMS